MSEIEQRITVFGEGAGYYGIWYEPNGEALNKQGFAQAVEYHKCDSPSEQEACREMGMHIIYCTDTPKTE